MVRVDLSTIRSLMDRPNNIRNVCVVAHVDHGKSSLVDSLLASNGIIPPSDTGKRRGTDTRDDEQLRGITIKSTSVSLLWNAESARKSNAETTGIFSAVPLERLHADGPEFLVNLIDTPGHVDFSSEVTAALRLCDGCVVLVDFVEGVCVQTENVLRQALFQGIRPVLCINKIDRAILELQLEPEEVYQQLNRVIDSTNAFIQSLGVFDESSQESDSFYLSPDRGNVLFTVGKQGWGFTIPQMARMYATLLKQDPQKLTQRLWGDHFFNNDTKKWSESADINCPRAFCKYVWEPIVKMTQACMSRDQEALDRLLGKVGISVTSQEREELPERELLRTVMYRWMPASEALLEVIVTHLPSPRAAQRYRVERLYTGPLDDETAQAIRACDPDGPLVMYVSKMIPTKDGKRFFAFGRVFSGTFDSSRKVRVLGSRFEMGKKVDLFENVSVQRLAIPMVSRMEPVDSVPCGNMVCVSGIDNHIMKTGTIVSHSSSHPIVGMSYSVAPVVRVSVSPKNPADLPKLTHALKLLNQTDPILEVTVDSNGQHIIGCAGELHLDICIHDLKEFLGNVEIVVAEPIVSFRETITKESSVTCLAKSPNHHNRLYAKAEPLSDELVAQLEGGHIQLLDAKERATRLATQFHWDVTEARKIWSFGPEPQKGLNVFVDCTKGIQYLNEIRDNVVAGFNWVSQSGFLAEEPLQGVRFNLIDAVLQSDSIHRGGGQIIPATRRVLASCQLSASPRILEPIYRVEIQCSESALSGVHNVLRQRRGVINDTQLKGGNMYQLKGYLPVMESFGFTSHLRATTSGQAFEQCAFDHWKLVDSDPYQTGSTSSAIILSIRERKGLKPAIPVLSDYLDKL